MQSNLNSKNISSAIQKIGDTIDTVMETIRPPLMQIPSILLLCEMLQRPGMSETILAAAIVAGLEKLGIPTGVNPDGSENLIVKSVQMGCKELVSHIHDYARVDSAAAPNSVAITGSGVAAGIAPVAVTGSNSSFISVNGGVR